MEGAEPARGLAFAVPAEAELLVLAPVVTGDRAEVADDDAELARSGVQPVPAGLAMVFGGERVPPANCAQSGGPLLVAPAFLSGLVHGFEYTAVKASIACSGV